MKTDQQDFADELARVAAVERAKRNLAGLGVSDIEHHPIVNHARMMPLDPNDRASAFAVLEWIEAAGFKVVPA